MGTRITESGAFLVAVLATLALLPLSQVLAASGTPEASDFQTSSGVLESTTDLASALVQSAFAIGAAKLYFLLLRSRLVPRWLSLWGLVAAPLFLVASSSLLWTEGPNSTFSTILYAPMALQEMVLALGLILRGFNLSAHARIPEICETVGVN